VTTLNLVLDEMLAPVPSATSVHTAELARALITYAPPGCFVAGIVASSPEREYEQIASVLPGLEGLFKSALTHRDLRAAWQHGFTPVPAGMIHAPSLFAPLRNHDRVNARGNQITVTIHDVTPWSHPELLPSRQVSWAKAMAQRALKYADAIVVPTHAVAAELSEVLPFGDRVRVIGSAVRSSLALGPDSDARAARLDLPERYLLSMGGDGLRTARGPLLAAMASVDVPLLIAGSEEPSVELSDAIAAARLPAGRVRNLGILDDADLAVVYSRAALLVHPSIVDGFGIAMLEAFSFGTPVIHSDAPALVEVAGDSGLVVAAGDPDSYPAGLADAINRVLGEDALRSRLGILGADRARLFSWRASAEGVWQLHADL